MVRVERSDVVAADCDSSPGWRDVTRNRSHQRRFSCAVRSDDCDEFPCTDCEVDVREHLPRPQHDGELIDSDVRHVTTLFLRISATRKTPPKIVVMSPTGTSNPRPIRRPRRSAVTTNVAPTIPDTGIVER